MIVSYISRHKRGTPNDSLQRNNWSGREVRVKLEEQNRTELNKQANATTHSSLRARQEQEQVRTEQATRDGVQIESSFTFRGA